MDIKQYIASGILEDYALNLLTREERLQVEQNAMQYPEIKAELNEIEAALETFAQANAIDVSPDLANSILQNIDALDAPPQVKEVPKEKRDNNTRPVRSKNQYWIFFLLLPLMVLVGYLLMKNNQQRAAIDQLSNNLIDTQNNLDAANRSYANCESIRKQLDEQLTILRNTNNKTVTLIPTSSDFDSTALAFVHYNPVEQKVYLEIEQLGPPQQGKQYQLWVLRTDQNPESMAQFTLPEDIELFIDREFKEGAIGFAISEEREGVEASQPTSDAIILSGFLSS